MWRSISAKERFLPKALCINRQEYVSLEKKFPELGVFNPCSQQYFQPKNNEGQVLVIFLI